MTLKRKKTAIALLAAFAVLYFAFAMWTRDRSPSISSSVESIRALGIATNFKELASSVPHEGEDAAPHYKKATDAWIMMDPKEEEAYLLLESELDPTTLNGRLKAIKTISDVLDPARKGAASQNWAITPHSPKEFTDYSEQGTILNQVEVLARIFLHVASAKQESGKIDEAFADLQNAENVSAQLGRNPGLMPKYSSAAIEGYVLNGLHQVMARHKDSVPVLLKSKSFLNSLPAQPSPYEMSVASFVESIYVYSDPALREPIVKKSRSVKEWFKNLIDEQVARRQAELDIEMWLRFFTDLDKKEKTGNEVFSALDDVSHRFRKNRYYLSDNTFETWRRQGSVMWKGVLAERRMFKISVELLLRRAANERLPSVLPDNGEDSLDPFSNQPFIYKVKSDKRFLIYSVAEDGTDNGGSPMFSHTSSYDIPYEF